MDTCRGYRCFLHRVSLYSAVAVFYKKWLALQGRWSAWLTARRLQYLHSMLVLGMRTAHAGVWLLLSTPEGLLDRLPVGVLNRPTSSITSSYNSTSTGLPSIFLTTYVSVRILKSDLASCKVFFFSFCKPSVIIHSGLFYWTFFTTVY